MGHKIIPVENKVRWVKWQVLQSGAWIQDALEKRLVEFAHNGRHFGVYEYLYFGCGPDGLKDKYAGYDRCDLRQMDGVMEYDVRLGIPVSHGHYEHVKSKLSWGMFTYNEAEWLMWEVSRILNVYGTFELTVRTLPFQYERHRLKEIDDKRLMLFVYGCSQGQYHGSFRKSGWTFDMLRDLANRYGFKNLNTVWRSANVTLQLERTNAGYLPYPESREPNVREDAEGNVVNAGGGDYRGKLWQSD